MNEPYPAQVLRRLHEDANLLICEYQKFNVQGNSHIHDFLLHIRNDLKILLQDCEEWLSESEDKAAIRQYVKSSLKTLQQRKKEIESLYKKEYGRKL